MKIKLLIILIVCTSLFIACKNTNNESINGVQLNNKYSKGFEILETDNGYLLKVKSRFENSDLDIDSYYLSTVTEKKDDIRSIKIPINKAVCLSTTHCAFISKLGEIETIKGISGINYVYDEHIINLIEENKISEVGYEKQINYEKIISLAPDVVFAYGVDNNSMSSYQKLSGIGIPVIYVGDFIEELPLGRTEWIKFFGCFYNKLDNAVEYFDSIECSYKKIMNNINSGIAQKPKVLVGLPWKGTWWVPGGNSFFANFIKDAGGDYIFNNNSKQESIPYTIEEIFSFADNVDVWLHPNSAMDRKEILQTDERLKNFAPIYRSRIFNNNKRTGISGGNDFWESGIVHPDLILKDLNYIFYPESTGDYDPTYYKELL